MRLWPEGSTIALRGIGTKNNRSVLYSLGALRLAHDRRRLACNERSPADQQSPPNDGHIVAAPERAEPGIDADAGLLLVNAVPPATRRGWSRRYCIGY